METEGNTLLKMYHAMRSDRAHVEPYYICASMYADPLNMNRWGNESGRAFNWNTDLFSGVGVRAAERFSNFMLGNATPEAARWLVLSDNGDMGGELDEAAEKYWAEATRSIARDMRGDGITGGSFYLSKRSEYRNLAISYGVSYIYEGEEHNGMTGKAVYRPVSPFNFYYQLDEFDRMTRCAYPRQMTDDDAEAMFGKSIHGAETDEARAKKSTERRTIVQIVVMNRNPKAVPRAPDEFPYLEYWVDEQEKRVIHRRGYYSQPFHVMGWNRVEGSSYFVGPVFNALPDLIGANAARAALKKAMEMVAFPPILGGRKMKGALKTLRPGHVTWGAIDDRGNAKLRPLDGLANPGALFSDVSDDEQRVSNALFEFDMNLPGTANMSATEVAERSSQRAATVAPFATTTMHALRGQIARHYEIKARAGTLPELPRSVAERGSLGVEMVGPLAMAARAAENASMLTAIDQIAMVEAIESERIDKDAAVLAIADRAGHASILRDPQEVKKEREARAQQEAALMQAEQGRNEAAAARDGAQALQTFEGI